MSLPSLFTDILETYTRHGWQLRRVLLRPETRAQLNQSVAADDVVESSVDAFWFSRPSHEGREAWELRLLAENPYALFETFEADETEEQREEMRQEMEARLRDYLNK